MNYCQKYIDEYLRENPKYICEIFIINYNEHANSLKCCNIWNAAEQYGRNLSMSPVLCITLILAV